MPKHAAEGRAYYYGYNRYRERYQNLAVQGSFFKLVAVCGGNDRKNKAGNQNKRQRVRPVVSIHFVKAGKRAEPEKQQKVIAGQSEYYAGGKQHGKSDDVLKALFFIIFHLFFIS
jgi:hypothetical protein